MTITYDFIKKLPFLSFKYEPQISPIFSVRCKSGALLYGDVSVMSINKKVYFNHHESIESESLHSS